MTLLDFAAFPLPANIAIFAVSGAVVWAAGTRLAGYVDAISSRTNIGSGFAGMLLLGGITSLPEVATTTTASLTGNAPLAVNNLLGSSSINLVLLAVADAVFGRRALTAVAASPGTILQATLGMLLMAVVAVAIMVGDVAVGPVGAWSTALILLCAGSLWFASRYERRHVWEAVDGEIAPEAAQKAAAAPAERGDPSLKSLLVKTSVAAGVILCAGFVLSQSADAISRQTGVGASLVGLVLVGFATSLPELSSILAALRLGRYDMAAGDIFGTNLFNVSLLFLTDLTYSGEPALSIADTFEAVAALLALILTGIFVLGFLERRDKTILRMGYDAAAVLATFLAGLVLLYTLVDQSAGQAVR